MMLETRSLDPADISRSYDIRSRAFGALPESARPGWESDARAAVDARRVLGVYDGSLLVGRAMIWPFRQFWGGRDLAMAGIAGVVVAPEHRGRGVGTALMTGVIERGRELGFPPSVLYPATVPVYRKRGWEIAGVQPRVTIQTRLLRELRGGDVTVREATPADAEQMLGIMRGHYASGRACGPRDYAVEEFAKELEDTSIFGYLAADGFVVYGWEGKGSHDVVVYQLVAARPETARALWAIVGSSSSVAERVHAYLAPDDPIHQLLGECVREESKQNRWMLRLLDVASAMSGRGFTDGVDIDVPVVLEDDFVPANQVTGRLRVAKGTAELVEEKASETDAVRLSANGVACLYAGMPMGTLITAGLASGGSEAHHSMLDAAFVGRPAYLLDYF
ncbi:MAG: GNAT family N-acetyltransferase [Nocardioidaceae bacterium]